MKEPRQPEPPTGVWGIDGSKRKARLQHVWIAVARELESGIANAATDEIADEGIDAEINQM